MSIGDEPMSEESVRNMRTILEEDPATAEKAQHLVTAADMGLQMHPSASPAFIGLLIARTVSARLKGYKNPEIQILVEDEKVIHAAWNCLFKSSHAGC
jgi:hypothetical protein